MEIHRPLLLAKLLRRVRPLRNTERCFCAIVLCLESHCRVWGVIEQGDCLVGLEQNEPASFSPQVLVVGWGGLLLCTNTKPLGGLKLSPSDFLTSSVFNVWCSFFFSLLKLACLHELI